VSLATTKIAIRLRVPAAASASVGLIAVMAAVGALFPAVGHSIGQLHVPKSVDNLLGGADYGTVTGWFRSEIGVIYGPLVIGALAITGASAVTAGEEEDGILALVLAYPISRSRLVAEKALGIGAVVVIVAGATWVGLIMGVALAGGGVSLWHMTALAVQLAFFGLASGALAIAIAAGTGRKALATGIASGVAVLGWLINSFAPLVSGLSWLKYLSLYYYYAGHDPLTRGLDVVGLLVLGLVTAALMAIAALGIDRRDLRG
jgi:ABC-2 type transport system permease protein